MSANGLSDGVESYYLIDSNGMSFHVPFRPQITNPQPNIMFQTLLR